MVKPLSELPDQDCSALLQQQVQNAVAARQPLLIRGAGSKPFSYPAAAGQPLEITGHRGIVNYQPVELLLTARAGTPLVEIDRVLAEQGQMLPFEPPCYAPGTTLGGAIASGLSGPARPYAGAARDFVLGCRLINGQGELLRFGGEVMKNVAGFDLARLMCGAMGTLGILLEVSLKVLPAAQAQRSLAIAMTEPEALQFCLRQRACNTPITATAYHAGKLRLRLAGHPQTLALYRQRLGAGVFDGEGLGEIGGDGDYWAALRDHRLPFFQEGAPLWRLSLPLAPMGDLADELTGEACLWEWGGQQRWLRSALPAARIYRAAQQAGGHATPFSATSRRTLDSLPAPLQALHQRLKSAFDPHHILNPTP